MSAICIITARGGSKRIPRKNIREFLGKPIIAYSIEAALQSGVYDEVMVSTDDEEIAQIARACGAQVPFLRSEKTSDDYATTADVLNEVLDRYEERGRSFEILSCVYPTAPFVTAQKLRQGYRMLLESDADGLTPVTAFSYPPQRAFVLREGCLTYQYPEYRRARSQDLETIYHDCGQFYFWRADVFRGRAPGTGRTLALILPETEVQDIDNLTDWALAELKYERFIGEER